MITYPFLTSNPTIGITAPSSGVPQALHSMFSLSCERMKQKGFSVIPGETVWTQHKAKSTSPKKRANELQAMIADENIDIIIPPWGGELLIEILEHLDFTKWTAKWVLGYSDTSVLLLAITLNTGIATAHGTNFVDLRGEHWDPTTAMWQQVLTTKKGESVVQISSDRYQKEWQHDNPSPCVFHLTEQTAWKHTVLSDVHIEGCLLGGCIDVIRHLVGTPFGDVKTFREKYIPAEPVIWYFDNCELTTADLRRSLLQLKLAGWFDNCSGILFGRSSANKPVDSYTPEDVYHDLASDLHIPVIYNIDCGHLPPQLTLINGAYASVNVEKNKGTVVQYFT
ncbi:Muramoyltetrapeptide carboxypeptidase LdcA (peptidoglycan recycling) [Priestia megaterium]|nr:Muramoyltetrapeptide carboxypeptidase LdcA (peptidoglycan recycling) [Priestia megaterium]